MSPQVALLILKTIDLLAAGMELLPDIRARKDAYVAQIKTMIEEDRGPSDEEMNALLAEGDELTDAIKASLERRE